MTELQAQNKYEQMLKEMYNWEALVTLFDVAGPESYQETIFLMQNEVLRQAANSDIELDGRLADISENLYQLFIFFRDIEHK